MDRAHHLYLKPSPSSIIQDVWHLLVDESLDQSLLGEHIFHPCLPKEEIALPIELTNFQYDCSYLLHLRSQSIIDNRYSDTSCYYSRDINSY